MTDCVVYVGNLNDPTFNLEGGDWNSNVPERLSPEFPPMSGHYNSDYHAWVKRKGARCEQTDFGAWVAIVSKADILDFIAQIYPANSQLLWHIGVLNDLKEFVAALQEDQPYGLVATEW